MVSITDELREWTRNHTYNGSDSRIALVAIVERIDAAHRAALEKLAAQMDETNDMRLFCERIEQAAAGREYVQLWGVDYVPLPVDADGVPIHVGDMVEDASVREIIEQVIQIRYTLATSSKAPTVLASIITDASQLPQKPSDYRHHHAMTVEDVLADIADKAANLTGSYHEGGMDGDEYMNSMQALVAEYAAKLQLREDA